MNQTMTKRGYLQGVAAAAGTAVLAAWRSGRASAQEEELPLWRRQPVQLVFWAPAVDASPSAQGWRDLVAQFQTLDEADRGQISVTIETYPVMTRETPDGRTVNLPTSEKIVASYAAGVGPDVTWSGAYWDYLAFGELGMCVDLEAAYIIRDDWYRSTMDDFYPHLLNSSRWEGRLWSLPMVTNADLPYTNLNLLRAAGMQPLKNGYTWDQWADWLKQAQRTLPQGKWAINGVTDSVQFINLLKQAGGDLYNSDRTRVVFNNQAGYDALQFISDLVHRHQVHVPVLPAGQPAPDFRNGDLVMHYETSTSRVLEWADRIGGIQNLTVTPAPTKRYAFTANFGTNVSMLKTTPARQDASWQFLRYATGPEASAQYTSTIFFLPVRRSSLESDVWRSRLESTPPFQAFIDTLNDAYRPTHPEYSMHVSRLGQVLADTKKEPRSVREDLNLAAADINVMLDNFNRTRPSRR